MAQSSNKKVVLTRFDRETLHGFFQTPGGFGPEGIELLTPEGALIRVPYAETKVVSFVKDFDSGETWRKHRSFAARPKSPGLWVKLTFRDGDTLEGMLPANLMLLEPLGFSLVPPDNQRIFVPRAALTEVQVLGVVGSSIKRQPKKPASKEEQQLEMFGEN